MAIVHLGAKRLQGTKVDRVSDSLGSSVDGTNTGITLITSGQKLGTGAYSFDGTDDKVVLGSASDWNFLSSATANTWSIVWWMKYDDTLENGHTIMSTTDGVTQTDGFFIDNSGSGTIRLIQVDGNNGSWSSAIPDNTSFHHYAITWNAGTVTLYVDGVSKGTQSQTAASGTPQYPLTLGVNNDDYYTALTLDDIGIYKRVLTATEISDLVNNVESTPTFTADLSSSSSQTWTTNGTGMAVDTTNEEIDYTNLIIRTDTNQKISYDLGSGNVSNDKWVLRYTLTPSDFSADSAVFGFISDTINPNLETNTDSIGTAINSNGGNTWFTGSSANGAKLNYDNQINQSSGGTALTNGTSYYVEIRRTSATAIDFTIRTGSHSGTTYGSYSGATVSGVIGLRYIVFGNANWGDGSATGSGTIKDIKFWNDVSSASTNEGALVSSLSDKSNLKANYTMDSTSLGLTATKETLDSTNGTTDWAEVGSRYTIDTSNNQIDFALVRDGSLYGTTTALYDLGASSMLNDTKFVLRYRLNFGTIDDPTRTPSVQFVFGAYSNTEGISISQDAITMFCGATSNTGNNWDFGVTDANGAYSQNPYVSFDASGTGVTGNNNWYVEMVRTSASAGVARLYSDSTYETLVQEKSLAFSTSNPQNLRYIGAKQFGSNTTATPTYNGYMSDVKIYNGVSSLDGCKNDFSATSALDGQTNLPVNTIFEQTNDTPTYWWKQSDNTWSLDGTTQQEPSLTNSAIWSMVGKQTGSTTTTLTGGKLRFDQATNHSTADSGAVAVFDTGGTTDKFVIRFNFTTGSSHTDGGGNAVIYWGLSSNDSYSSSQGFITGNSGNSADAVFFRWHIYSNKTRIGYYNGGTISWGTNPNENLTFTDSTTYYFELSFDGSTTTLKRFTDSTYGTATHTGTQTSVSGVSGLRYFVLGNTVDTQMGVFTIDNNKFEIQKDRSTWLE